MSSAVARVESEQKSEVATLRTQYRNELAERKRLFNVIQVRLSTATHHRHNGVYTRSPRHGYTLLWD